MPVTTVMWRSHAQEEVPMCKLTHIFQYFQHHAPDPIHSFYGVKKGSVGIKSVTPAVRLAAIPDKQQ